MSYDLAAMAGDTEEQIKEYCPSCEVPLDVTEQQVFTQVKCPNCGDSVHVRALFDQFMIRKLIGEGGMSRVFKTRDSTLGREVALKILNRDFSKSEVRIAQFEKEAKLTASISHPNVVKVFSVGRDQGQFYIAMELVRGGSLEEKIRKSGNVSEKRVLDVALEVAQGLQAAQKVGLVHRDIKPGNILFSKDGTTKIVDFGLALVFDRDVDDSGEIWATPFYVPPEKLRNEPDDFRGDIYSLGATLFHAVVGSPPHEAETASIEELKKIKEQPVQMAKHMPDANLATCRVIDRMCAASPDKRQSSYDELVDEIVLARAALDAPEGSVVVPELEDEGQQRRRKLMGIGLAVLAVIVGLILILGQGGDSGGGSVPAIVTGGTQSDGATITDRFLAGRRTLLSKDYDESAQIFSRLSNAEDIPAQTLYSAYFNGGLSHLLGGELKSARAEFEKLGKAREVEGIPEGLGVFYGEVSDLMMIPGAPAKEAAMAFEGRPFSPLGKLVGGLKAFHNGSMEVGREVLEELDGAEVVDETGSYAWVKSYLELAKPFVRDSKRIGELPELDPAIDEATLVERLALLEDVGGRIETTGRAPEIVARQKEWYEGLGKRLAEGGNEEPANFDGEALEKAHPIEIDDLLSIAREISEMGYELRFKEGVALLDGLNFESPEVRSAVEDHLYLWRGADACLTRIQRDLNEKGWSGAITRSEQGAEPLVGTVTAADNEGITIRVSFGETSIPYVELREWVIRTAWQFAEGTSDSTKHYQRLEEIVAFSRLTGMTEFSNNLSARLMGEHRDFRLRWMRVLETVGTSG